MERYHFRSPAKEIINVDLLSYLESLQLSYADFMVCYRFTDFLLEFSRFDAIQKSVKKDANDYIVYTKLVSLAGKFLALNGEKNTEGTGRVKTNFLFSIICRQAGLAPKMNVIQLFESRSPSEVKSIHSLLVSGQAVSNRSSLEIQARQWAQIVSQVRGTQLLLESEDQKLLGVDGYEIATQLKIYIALLAGDAQMCAVRQREDFAHLGVELLIFPLSGEQLLQISRIIVSSLYVHES